MGRICSRLLDGCLCLGLLAHLLHSPPCLAQSYPHVSGGYASAASLSQPERLNNVPSNPLEFPENPYQQGRSPDSVPFSNSLLQGVLPQIPNLQWGYIWTFGNQPQGRLILDYTLPVKMDKDVAFCEVHSRFEDLIKTLRGNPLPNVQVLLGGGYRKRLTRDFMIGANGFYNTTRLYGRWYSSGILGLETCVLMPGSGIVDASFYYYGNVFSGNTGIFAAFSKGGGDFKFEGAYSQSFFHKDLIVRFKASHYIFHKLGNVPGYYVGADFRSSDGMYRCEYVYGQDAVSGRYQNLGLYVTVGFRLEKLIQGNNPFSKP